MRDLMLQLHSVEEFAGDGVPVTWVSCIGTVTAAEAGRLRDQLLAQLRHGPRHLVLDLTESVVTDAALVTVVADVHHQAQTAACTFSLISPSLAAAALGLDGQNRPVALHATLTDALLALGPSDDDSV